MKIEKPSAIRFKGKKFTFNLKQNQKQPSFSSSFKSAVICF